MDKEQLYDLKDELVSYMKQAGVKAQRIRERGYSMEEKTANDFVTEADIAVEQYLIDNFKKLDVKAQFLAEESQDSIDAFKEGDLVWVIDPIDGTINFMHNVNGYWAISVALVKINKQGLLDTQLGVLMQPDINKVYYAIKGEGSYVTDLTTLKTTRLQPSKINELGKSIIITGLSRSLKDSKRTINAISELIENVSGIRRLGAASLDLVSISRGVGEAYFEGKIKPWDYAAGWLIAKESGLIVTDMDFNPIKLQETSIFCSTSHIYDKVKQYIK